ncbi:MAG: hypothetical protein FWF84_06860 [Kiritimatiellaeota bacterium]|nr:hypothetical protein [Kiritimatiellota bacterium]
MRKLHVASSQIVSQGGAAETLPLIDRISKAAALLGCDAILFSEVAIHGYDYDLTPESIRAVAEPVTGPIAQAVSAMAAKNNIVIMAGTLELCEGNVYNAHLIAFPSGDIKVQRKAALTGGEVRGKFTAGERKRVLFDIKGVKCAILICADTGLEGIYDEMREQGVEYLFIPTGGGGDIKDTLSQAELLTDEGRKKYEENRPRVCMPNPFDADFQKNKLGFTSANALGRAGAKTCHQGHCIITDQNGVLRAQAVGTIVREHHHQQLINAILTFD